MATKALTHVAPRARRDQVSLEVTPRQGGGWRELLTEEDGDAIWDKLSHLVRSSHANPQATSDLTTQELFLHLLTSGRFRAYIELGFSEDEIGLDILSCLPEQPRRD
ncbi:MAG TPA: hypothetical protein VE262_13665 [Blastocatellia bacterium]|nr:hypothetical protein [Blastocatellia bacterium]